MFGRNSPSVLWKRISGISGSSGNEPACRDPCQARHLKAESPISIASMASPRLCGGAAVTGGSCRARGSGRWISGMPVAVTQSATYPSHTQSGAIGHLQGEGHEESGHCLALARALLVNSPKQGGGVRHRETPAPQPSWLRLTCIQS